MKQQENTIKSLETGTWIYGHLVYDPSGASEKLEMTRFSVNGAGTTGFIWGKTGPSTSHHLQK